MTLKGKSLVSLCIFILMVFLFIMSFEYNPKARLFPTMVSGIIAVFALFQFLRDAFPSLKPYLKFVDKKGVFSKENLIKDIDQQQAKSEVDPVPWKQIGYIFLWIIGFTILIKFNYAIAIVLFVFFFTWLVSRESLKTSIILALSIGISMYLVFTVVFDFRG